MHVLAQDPECMYWSGPRHELAEFPGSLSPLLVRALTERKATKRNGSEAVLRHRLSIKVWNLRLDKTNRRLIVPRFCICFLRRRKRWTMTQISSQKTAKVRVHRRRGLQISPKRVRVTEIVKPKTYEKVAEIWDCFLLREKRDVRRF